MGRRPPRYRPRFMSSFETFSGRDTDTGRADYTVAPGRRDLAGPWRAHEADEELRRRFVSPGFDDSSWPEVAVPGHWRANPALEVSDGPVLYRSGFEASGASDDRRTWLSFDGILATSDIWLDGSYLGDTEGYFSPQAIEITSAVAGRSEHELALEVACPGPADAGSARCDLLGAYADASVTPPGGNAGGIWRPVALEETGPVRVCRLRVLCREADGDAAALEIVAMIDSDRAGAFEVVTRLGELTEDRQTHTLAAGENHISWVVAVSGAELWWPWSLGPAHLHGLVVEVLDGHGELSHRVTRRVGLRTVDLSRWVLRVNGERVFPKGFHLPPSDAAGETEGARRIIDAARRVGADMVRLNAHVAPPELYDAADEAGMLIWQDLPLAPISQRSIRERARRMAVDAVDAVGHHASVVVWCGRHEVSASRAGPGAALGHSLPTWNRAVLDRTVSRALSGADPTRPVVAASGRLPHPPMLTGTDSHIALDAAPDGGVSRLVRRWPRLGGFVGRLETPALDAGEAALVTRRAIETLRRLKDRPCGGVLGPLVAPEALVGFAGPNAEESEGAGAEMIEHLRAALAPVIIAGDVPSAILRPGDDVDLELHVVNDSARFLSDCRLVAEVLVEEPGLAVDPSSPLAGERRQRQVARQSWSGSVAPDGVAHVATLRLEVPEAVRPARLRLLLTIDGPGVRAANEYVSTIDDGN